MIEKAKRLREKLKSGKFCVGTVISLSDPSVTEALCPDVDFIWIDMEHSALSLEQTQAHIGATAAYEAAPIVRVPWNDHVWIKRILDTGPAGLLIPQIKTADDVRQAIEASLYPPDGIRGFGPRRNCEYGRMGGPDFCRETNEALVIFVQIEHIDAVRNIDEILKVPGLFGILIGPNDLSGSMGHMGNPGHPEVLDAAKMVIKKAAQAGIYPGVATGCNIEALKEWIDRGVSWISMGADFLHMTHSSSMIAPQLRAHAENNNK